MNKKIAAFLKLQANPLIQLGSWFAEFSTNNKKKYTQNENIEKMGNIK